MAATINTRSLQAFHGGALVGTDNFVGGTGYSAGGLMSYAMQFGYDDIVVAPADGLSFPEVDRLGQFCRGTITCQDWTEVINVLNNVTTSYVFYSRESGLTSFSKYTLTAPVVYAASFSFTHRGYASCTWNFETRAASEAVGFSAAFGVDNATGTAPAATLTTARGIEITAAQHATDTTDINHVTNLTCNIAGRLVKASQDGDVGYTAVDVVWGGAPMGGSITFQDSADSNVVKAVTLAGLAEEDLTVTIKQSQAGSKSLVLKNCVFTDGAANYTNDGTYAGYTMNFILNSDQTTPIGTAGDGAGGVTDYPYTGDTAGITIT